MIDFDEEEESIPTIKGVASNKQNINKIQSHFLEILISHQHTQMMCQPQEQFVVNVPTGCLGYIDKYEIIKSLGGGGFGVVYLVRDDVSNLEYAIKTLNNVEEKDKLRDELRANFKLVSVLTHSNIAKPLLLHNVENVNIYDKNILDELAINKNDKIILMEYAPGITLSNWVKQFEDKCAPFNLAIEICKQIAKALDYTHSNGIIHRDIKPENVMIETLPDGKIVARILDFGLAKRFDRYSEESCGTSGTKPYMDPEQWNGTQQGPATDQYSLACLLYELISGKVPFFGVFQIADYGLIIRVVNKEKVAPIKKLNRNNNKVLLKALSKNPSQRWNSCSEFIDSFSLKSKKKKNPYMIVGFILALALFYCIFINKNQYSFIQKISSTKEQIVEKQQEGKGIIVNNSSCKSNDDNNDIDPVSLVREGNQFFKRKDYANAFKRFELAAKMGNGHALNNLGNCYLLGYGVGLDKVKAFINFKLASQKGIVTADYNLGRCYQNGWGTRKDLTLANLAYDRAAKLGNSDAQNILGVNYENGIGVEKNLEKAFDNYQKAASNGNAKGKNNLGLCYFKGLGVKKDVSHAYKLFVESSNMGCVDGFYNLGYCYENGVSVEKNLKKAFECYQKAASKQHSQAEYSLGRCYYYGYGVTKDLGLAKEYFQRSAQHGNLSAKQVLQQLGY